MDVRGGRSQQKYTENSTFSFVLSVTVRLRCMTSCAPCIPKIWTYLILIIVPQTRMVNKQLL